jgi:endonuclease YncB( thermonuclease family)
MAAVALVAMIIQPAHGEDVPSGVIERERMAVLDGDSITVDGREWRLMGFDVPEFADAKCEGEHRAGLFAKRRLTELVANAKRIEVRFSGKIDRQQRALGELLVDGRNVREVLINEGYARAYTGGRIKDWCERSSRHDLMPDPDPDRK